MKLGSETKKAYKTLGFEEFKKLKIDKIIKILEEYEKIVVNSSKLPLPLVIHQVELKL